MRFRVQGFGCMAYTFCISAYGSELRVWRSANNKVKDSEFGVDDQNPA